ncbi:hypothetical protein BKA64DRAFT_650199 [Cadophora sp. MPI-SDFR-AT-0126]|nr:hypothetical protein BKA64DRAFT_650199 [Leotiomycetes sp. MPI-SDFR-AT-0126]
MATHGHGGPPPPPPPPGQFRPPPQQGGLAPPRPQGGQGPPPPQFMAMPIRQPLQQSVRIQDITPAKILDEAACLKKLTTYAAYTIRKVAPRDAKERPTWARAEVVEEKYPQEEVSKQIKKLNESKRTVSEKKAALAPFQQGQITSLLDDLGSREPDSNFQWSLVQMTTKEKPISSSRGTSKKSLYETVTMTVFVKRAPVRDVNPMQLFQTLERIKADRLRPPPPAQPKQQQQQQQGGGGGGQGGGQGGGHGGPPGGNQQQGNRAPAPPPAFVQINKGGPPPGGNHNKPQIVKQPQRGGKRHGPRKYHGGSSSSDSYDSDSMSESSSGSDSLDTSISAESKRHRRPSKGATRRHSFHRESGPKYYLEPRSHERASDAFGGIPPQHRPYAPDVPRAVPAIDPITSAYQAGKEDAMAERFGADRFAQQAQQIAQPIVQVVERIIEPRPVVSYGRMEPQFAERPRLIEPRYIDERYVDDLRSVEDDIILRQRRAEEYIDRRPLEPREYFERRPSDFERRPFERPEFERRFSEVRPLERREFFDRPTIGRDNSPPRVFLRDSHPFAPTPLPRRYPVAPSTNSSFEHGW